MGPPVFEGWEAWKRHWNAGGSLVVKKKVGDKRGEEREGGMEGMDREARWALD